MLLSHVESFVSLRCRSSEWPASSDRLPQTASQLSAAHATVRVRRQGLRGRVHHRRGHSAANRGGSAGCGGALHGGARVRVQSARRAGHPHIPHCRRALPGSGAPFAARTHAPFPVSRSRKGLVRLQNVYALSALQCTNCHARAANKLKVHLLNGSVLPWGRTAPLCVSWHLVIFFRGHHP